LFAEHFFYDKQFLGKLHEFAIISSIDETWKIGKLKVFFIDEKLNFPAIPNRNVASQEILKLGWAILTP
jgi:hypothetical protein